MTLQKLIVDSGGERRVRLFKVIVVGEVREYDSSKLIVVGEVREYDSSKLIVSESEVK